MIHDLEHRSSKGHKSVQLINAPLKGPVRNLPLTGHIADIMESTRLTPTGPSIGKRGQNPESDA